MMNKKPKSPLKKGVAKVPVIMQMEALECGVACLAMVFAWYGKWITLEQLREDCGVSRDGSSAKNMLRAARGYGMTANAYKVGTTEKLMSSGRFPCIVHWDFNHFIVVDGFRNGKAYVNDPARGSVVMPIEEFDEGFTGVAILLWPGDDFEMSGAPRSLMSYISKPLKGMGGIIVFVLLITIIMSLANIITSGMTRFFLDQVLESDNMGLLYRFTFSFGLIVLIQISCAMIRDIYMLRIKGQYESHGNSSFLWKVLHLPMRFFSQRLAGDIHMRQNLHASVANTIIGSVVPIFLNTAMAIFYVVVMIRYSLWLTLIGLAGLLLNGATAGFIARIRVNITRVLMRDEGKLEAATVSGIEMMDTIKASGAEDGFFRRWAGFQASANLQKVRSASADAYLGIIPSFISEGVNALVLLCGVWLMIKGEFTAGMVMAFQRLLEQFMTPSGQVVDSIQDLQELRTQMERIEDVMEYPEDPVIMEDSITDDSVDYSKLSGALSIKNLTFGYAKYAEPLIKDFSLELKSGQSVAFVGSSGCGKSTLANLIMGMYEPWSGEILFDGKKVNEIDHNVFTGSVSVVDQEIILFEDTIANNIKMWDRTIEDFEMILAARDASVDKDIIKREGGYNHMLSEGGKNLSGGQRQRLEIARVLAQAPTIIVMDEATSALDARTEARVMKAIRASGITSIIVAHRLSTIRDCDEIIVLDKGHVVQRGVHSQLMQEDGLYRELVANE